MNTPQLAARSELPSTEETPGRDTYYKEKERNEVEWLRKRCPSDSDEDTDEEIKDDDDKGKDPDFEGEKPSSRTRAAANGAGPKKPRPSGLQKPRKRCEFLKLAEENPLRVAFEKAEAKKDAAGALELEAAVSAIEKWDLYDTAPRSSKTTYKQIVSEVQDWAKRGGTKATAASWIRRLMSKGTDRLLPSDVRPKYKRTPPGAA